MCVMLKEALKPKGLYTQMYHKHRVFLQLHTNMFFCDTRVTLTYISIKCSFVIIVLLACVSALWCIDFLCRFFLLAQKNSGVSALRCFGYRRKMCRGIKKVVWTFSELFFSCSGNLLALFSFMKSLVFLSIISCKIPYQN